MSYPNQKHIKVNKYLEGNRNIKFEIEAIDNAAKRLAGASFKLWMYFSINEDESIIDLSPTAFGRWSGYKIDAYKAAVKDLISQGFLIKCKKENQYIFKDYPIDHKVENDSDVNRDFRILSDN